MNISKAMTEKFPAHLKGKRSVLKHNNQTYSFEFFSSQEDTQVTVLSPWLQPGILRFREGNGTPLQYSCMENAMDGGAWMAAVHGVAKSQARLSDFTFTFHIHALEKEMATHSSVLPWRIPGMAEPGGLPSMGSHRVRHDWSGLAVAAAELKTPPNGRC